MAKYNISESWIFEREELFEFAHLTGDSNPMHLDEKKACNSGLADISVHGALQIARLTAFIGSGGFMDDCTCITAAGEFLKPLYPQEEYLVLLSCHQSIPGLGIFSAKCIVTDEQGTCRSRLTCDFQTTNKLLLV